MVDPKPILDADLICPFNETHRTAHESALAFAAEQLEMQRVCEAHPNAKGVMLGGHGLINWADDDKACYLLSLSLIERAEEYLKQNGKATYAFGGATYEPLPEERRNQTLAEVLPWLPRARPRRRHAGLYASGGPDGRVSDAM